MWIPPPEFLHPTRTVVIIDILLRTCAFHSLIISYSISNFSPGSIEHSVYDASTPHKILNYFPIIISIFLACYRVANTEKCSCACVWPPFCFYGPLFGRTWWTCLNPPLSDGFTIRKTSLHRMQRRKNYSTILSAWRLVMYREKSQQKRPFPRLLSLRMDAINSNYRSRYSWVLAVHCIPRSNIRDSQTEV